MSVKQKERTTHALGKPPPPTIIPWLRLNELWVVLLVILGLSAAILKERVRNAPEVVAPEEKPAALNQVDPFRSIVAARSGVVAQVAVRRGQAVEQGKLLISMQNQDLAAELKQADDYLARASAELHQARLELDEIEKTRKQLTMKSKRFTGTPSVVHTELPEQDAFFDLKRTAARSRVSVARSTISHALQVRDVVNRRYQASVVRSPISGVCAEVSVSEGAQVSAGKVLVRVKSSSRAQMVRQFDYGQ